ncbi:NB-ARC domains-containing protein [Artemisia annua]|uniref:NB-ARC domains-containing protein n=1 Tax=Artemisia annua TaxID=35608 RepID=A0A2U1NX30_ARTAN|nr:NB-ARC domains-containing protein [Artemisia annua]
MPALKSQDLCNVSVTCKENAITHANPVGVTVSNTDGDKVFPSWIVDSKFVRLSRILVSRCRNYTFLPPLGNLPSLKKLFIKDLDEVKDVGSEFVGAGCGPAFSSLESPLFPCLQEPTLRNCPNLVIVSLKLLPSLRILEIKNCGDSVLRSLIRVASSVTKLSIEGISGLTDGVDRCHGASWGS